MQAVHTGYSPQSHGRVTVNIRSLLYKTARVMGDVNAARKGTVAKRVARRTAGRMTGRALGKLFK